MLDRQPRLMLSAQHHFCVTAYDSVVALPFRMNIHINKIRHTYRVANPYITYITYNSLLFNFCSNKLKSSAANPCIPPVLRPGCRWSSQQDHPQGVTIQQWIYAPAWPCLVAGVDGGGRWLCTQWVLQVSFSTSRWKHAKRKGNLSPAHCFCAIDKSLWAVSIQQRVVLTLYLWTSLSISVSGVWKTHLCCAVFAMLLMLFA